MRHRAESFFLLVSLTFCGFCHAQPTTSLETGLEKPSLHSSSLEGTLHRPDGGSLHDIRIEVRASDTAKIVAICSTNQSGGFEARDLPPGTYDVVASDGKTETRERVDLQAGSAKVKLFLAPTPAITPKIGTISVIALQTPAKARELTLSAGKALLKNRFEQARKDIQHALAIAPNYPDALTTRAVIELSDNKIQPALEDLNHAIKVDPANGSAYLVMGAVMNQLGRYDDALWDLDRGSAYDPKSWQCAYEASKAWMGKRDYAHAVEQLNRAEKLSAKRGLAPIRLLRGYALFAQKRFDQAREDLESYLRAEPNGQHAGSARAALAKLRTFMVQAPDTLTLPAMTGMFAGAQRP